jgi:hypothetical protein
MRTFYFYLCIIFTIVANSVKAEPFKSVPEIKDTLSVKQTRVISSKIENKFFALTEFNSALGLSKINDPISNYYVGISEVVGYRIEENLWTGVGSGILMYNGGKLLPIYLDTKYYLGDNELSSFFTLNIGSLIRISGVESTPRLFINPGYGLKFKLSQNMALITSMGILSQWEFNIKRRDSFINFKLGVAFY